MDFSFNLNVVLREEITIVTNKDLLFSSSSSNYYNRSKNHLKHESSQNLSKIIDTLGAGSAKAQNLRGAITSSFKLKSSEDHLYILKDKDGNKGFGCVVGMIRTGKKRLFLSDVFGNQHECQPLCILDFYVHESKQRSGFGRKLFDFMIQQEKIVAHQLAIDRPSPKFVNFLKKHFQLENPLNQINKFVIFQSFFQDEKAIGLVDQNRRKSAPMLRNKLLDKQGDQGASRNVSSANSLRKSRLDISNALGNLSGVNPVVRADPLRRPNGQHSPLLNMRNNNLHHSQQRNEAASFSGISSYSRHSMAHRHSSSPLSPLVKNSRKPHEENHRNLLRDQHAEMHGRNSNGDHGNQQITSLDNPFCATPNNFESSSERSYTLGLVDQLSKQSSLGTGWNVFGVPSSHVKTSNPYAQAAKSSHK